MAVPHRRGPWSNAEDSYLMQLVSSHGPLNWVRIAQTLGSRTPKQCRERYHQNLKPTLNHNPITPEEGLEIEQLVEQLGKRWAEIARRLDGRSDNAVKNWWNGSQNRRKRLDRRRSATSAAAYDDGYVSGSMSMAASQSPVPRQYRALSSPGPQPYPSSSPRPREYLASSPPDWNGALLPSPPLTTFESDLASGYITSPARDYRSLYYSHSVELPPLRSWPVGNVKGGPPLPSLSSMMPPRERPSLDPLVWATPRTTATTQGQLLTAPSSPRQLPRINTIDAYQQSKQKKMGSVDRDSKMELSSLLG